MPNDMERDRFHKMLYAAADGRDRIEIWKNGDGRWVAHSTKKLPDGIAEALRGLLVLLNH